jgi:hypothetical protein
VEEKYDANLGVIMFYCKTITIPNTSAQLIERAIRSYTVKRSIYLDFLITAGEYHENKFFSGIEKENAFLLTRLSDIDRAVTIKGYKRWKRRNRPKVIVRFRKDKEFTSYQLRFGFLSSTFFCILFLGTILSVWYLFHGARDPELCFFLLISFTGWVVMAYKEIRLTQKLISKAIQRTRDDDLLARNIS